VGHGKEPVDSWRLLRNMKQEAPSSAPKETGRGSSLKAFDGENFLAGNLIFLIEIIIIRILLWIIVTALKYL